MRAFGLAQAAAGDANWSIDSFTHCRELIVQADCLKRPYFEQGVVTIAAQMMMPVAMRRRLNGPYAMERFSLFGV